MENINEQTLSKQNDIYFETIPLKKFIFLLISTLGLYSLVYYYKLWKTIAIKNNLKISPFWRAMFATFSNFWLFPILEKFFKNHNIQEFNAIPLAVLYLILGLCTEIPFLGFFPWIWMICIIASLQKKINQINSEFYPQAKVNNWNSLNTTWIIILSIFVIISVFKYSD